MLERRMGQNSPTQNNLRDRHSHRGNGCFKLLQLKVYLLSQVSHPHSLYKKSHFKGFGTPPISGHFHRYRMYQTNHKRGEDGLLQKRSRVQKYQDSWRITNKIQIKNNNSHSHASFFWLVASLSNDVQEQFLLHL